MASLFSALGGPDQLQFSYNTCATGRRVILWRWSRRKAGVRVPSPLSSASAWVLPLSGRVPSFLSTTMSFLRGSSVAQRCLRTASPKAPLRLWLRGYAASSEPVRLDLALKKSHDDLRICVVEEDWSVRLSYQEWSEDGAFCRLQHAIVVWERWSRYVEGSYDARTLKLNPRCSRQP